MAKKKADAFAAEIEILQQAKGVIDKSDVDFGELRTAYAVLCDEYEKLLEEVKFLTKISDKLESKLNDANEQLRNANEGLLHEVDVTKTEKEKVLAKNKKLSQEISQVDTQMNKSQLILIVLGVVVVLLIIVIVWFFVLGDGGTPHNVHR